MNERSTTLTVVGLAGIGLIHLLDSVDTYRETRWLFWAYVLLMVGTIVVSAALVHQPEPRWFALALLLAVAPLVGYVLSRSTGLPGADDDVGNWTEPLGLASLWVEGAVVATAGYALARVPRTTPEPARALTFGPLET